MDDLDDIDWQSGRRLPGRWAVLEADVREAFGTELPDTSIDAVLCDPPYGLQFMGADWDHEVPGPKHWQAIRRTLKPGAHLLAFGGRRTAHRLTGAIETAGCTIRDQLMWLYGSGFGGLGQSVDKAIDEKAGAERETLGVDEYRASRIPNGRNTDATGDWNYGTDGRQGDDFKITAPATPEAERWDGWDTTLAPGHEPITLAREPVEPIDCRAIHEATGWDRWIAVDRTSDGVRRLKAKALHDGADTLERRIDVESGDVLDETREPFEPWSTDATVACALVYGTGALHIDACRVSTAGGETVETKPQKPANEDGRTIGSYWSGDVDASERNGRWPATALLDPVAAAMVDAQSGERPATLTYRDGAHADGKRMGHPSSADAKPSSTYDNFNDSNTECYADIGGASRFFPHGPRFKYTSKASRTEREAGLLEAPGERENRHRAVKPVDLCEWLARLIQPPARPDGPPRTVAVPYAGSGSEMVGAMLAGWDRVVGVEIDPGHCEVARRRLQWWADHGREAVEAHRSARDRLQDEAESGQATLFDE